MKRKRKAKSEIPPDKRPKLVAKASGGASNLLRRYYPEVVSLRQYLVASFSQVSKKRRRSIDHYGVVDETQESVVKGLPDLLDSVIVGCPRLAGAVVSTTSLEKELEVFSQQLSDSTGRTISTQGSLTQSEVGAMLDLSDRLRCCINAQLSVVC